MGNTSQSRLAVVAVGGNALIKDNQHRTIPDQYRVACETMVHIADMIEAGWRVVVTHGNGPQVGFILRRSELSVRELHPVPLDYCGADTQGAIGYMFQQALHNEFEHRGLKKRAVTIVTQTLVDRDDPAFQNPTKPIGSFMDEATATEHRRKDGWAVVEDAGRGWRRVVPSPRPVRIIEQDIIATLVEAGFVVIAVGGGGVPVIEDANGELAGVEAVIDKDKASSSLAHNIEAEMFIIPTQVEKVALDFQQPNQQWLDHMTLAEAKKYLAEGHFLPGSMEPKIEAVIRYLEQGGKKALITTPENIMRALERQTGTYITP